LACGTAYVSAWLARRGACPFGLDVSATLEWSRQWPCEEVWKARKRD
jgi:hypothetical protein